MKRRTFKEMISYFNQTVSDMDIDRKYKMTLLGIVTALLQKHDEDVAQIVRCKDCKRHNAKAGKLYMCDLLNVWYDGDFFCANGERSEE